MVWLLQLPRDDNVESGPCQRSLVSLHEREQSLLGEREGGGGEVGL